MIYCLILTVIIYVGISQASFLALVSFVMGFYDPFMSFNHIESFCISTLFC